MKVLVRTFCRRLSNVDRHLHGFLNFSFSYLKFNICRIRWNEKRHGVLLTALWLDSRFVGVILRRKLVAIYKQPKKLRKKLA